MNKPAGCDALSYAGVYVAVLGINRGLVKLAAIAEKMVGQYPDQLPLPAIAPTPEGNLLLEWDAPGDPSVDLHLDSMRAAFHAFQPGDAETEHEIPLTTAASWGEFFSFLNERLRQRPA